MQEIVQANYFIERPGTSSLVRNQFKQRVESLNEELRSLPQSKAEARTVLFFSGKPVVGSRAIDAKFVADVLDPFLEVVKSQYAASKHGMVGERGPRRDEDEARLLITGTPRGSFGIELAAPQTDDLFAEERLAEVLLQVTRLLEAAGHSDSDYLSSLEDIHDRAFNRVPQFFDVLERSGAGLRMQTGDLEFELSQSEIAAARERVNISNLSVKPMKVEGVFRGVVLDKWRFDFRPEGSSVISGRVAPDLREDQVAPWNSHTNERVEASLVETVRVTPGGTKRTSYVLNELILLE